MENKNLIIFGLLAVSGISFYLYKKEADKVAVPKSSSNKSQNKQYSSIIKKSGTVQANEGNIGQVVQPGMRLVQQPNCKKFAFLKDVTVGSYNHTALGGGGGLQRIKQYKKGETICGEYIPAWSPPISTDGSPQILAASTPGYLDWVDDGYGYQIAGAEAKAMADAAGSASFSGNEQYWQAFR